MIQLIMDNLITVILQAIIPSILAAVAWKQRETSKKNEARRVREKSELEAKNAREKSELEARLLETKNEAQARLEQVESQQIRIQAEADSLRSTHDHHAELIKHMGRTEDARNQESARWRELMDGYRNSFLEAERLRSEDGKMSRVALKENTATIAAIGEHFVGFGRVMQHFEGRLDTTLQTVETTARDNRSDLTTALGMNVTHRTENESNLRSILQAIESVRTDVKYILTQSETQRNQTLSSVHAKFDLIEERLTEFISPRPALLGVTETANANNRADKPPSDKAEDNRLSG